MPSFFHVPVKGGGPLHLRLGDTQLAGDLPFGNPLAPPSHHLLAMLQRLRPPEKVNDYRPVQHAAVAIDLGLAWHQRYQVKGELGLEDHGAVVAATPGLIEWPARIRKPRTTDMPVVTSDIYPTIVDILGLKVANPVEPIDGISWLPLLDGQMTERPRPIGFWHYGGPPAKFDADGGQAAWSDNRYKLVKLGPGKHELYDLVKDRNETQDQAAANPEVAARMKRELDAWQASVLRSYQGADYKK